MQPEDEPSAPAPPATRAPLPPTAVGSWPALADELVHDSGQTLGDSPIPDRAAVPLPTELRKPARRDARLATRRKYRRSTKTAIKAFVVAIVVLVGANAMHQPAAVVVLWLVAGTMFVATVVAANRARNHIASPPDGVMRVVASLALMVLGVVGFIGVGLGAWTVLRAEPADDAPLGIGSLSSVRDLRWGYQRLSLIAATDWERPAKDDGSCWRLTTDVAESRRPERVETNGRLVRCQLVHTVEVIDAFAPNRDADAAFPGAAELNALAFKRCGPALAALNEANVADPTAKATLQIERPTEVGWDDADHDLVCLAITPVRKGSIRD